MKIDVVGRIDLKGDIGGRFLTALNKLFVEKYGDRLNIREFKAPDVVLHSKIMMIDERLVAISSVNLNNRSFFHDSENGMVVLDPTFYARMKPIYQDYVAHSRPVATNVTIAGPTACCSATPGSGRRFELQVGSVLIGVPIIA